MLTRRLATAEADLAKWKIDFEFEADAKELSVTVVGKNPKPGTRGARKVITLDDIEHYSDNLETVVQETAESYYEFFLKELIYNELSERLIPMFKNNLKIAGRK